MAARNCPLVADFFIFSIFHKMEMVYIWPCGTLQSIINIIKEFGGHLYDITIHLGRKSEIRGAPNSDPPKRGLGGSKKIYPPHVTYLGPK